MRIQENESLSMEIEREKDLIEKLYSQDDQDSAYISIERGKRVAEKPLDQTSINKKTNEVINKSKNEKANKNMQKEEFF